ncbi:MAG TPA: ATP-binding protein [Aggregatilineales bacterium]|nr:ATP-binding protein [Aggregatilineales bacterium]
MGAALLNRIWRLVRPPILADEHQNRLAGLIHYFLLALMVGTSLNLLAVVAGGVHTDRTVFPILVFLLSLPSFAALRRGYVRAIGLLLTCEVWLLATSAAVTGSGIFAYSLSLYAVAIVLGAVILGERPAIAVTALSILATIILALMQGWGVFPGKTILTPSNVATIYVGLYLGVFTILYLTARSIRNTLARVQRSEQALGERNRELELEIAKREYAFNTLHTSEEKYRLLFDVSLLATVIYDPGGEILMINKNFAAGFGKVPEDCVGKSVFDLLSPDLSSFLRRETGLIIETGRGSTREVQFPDGRWFQTDVQPVYGAPDRLYGLQLVARNVTENKQMQQDRAALALAVEKASFLTDFLATLSHDIKTPLSVINISLYLLERLDDPQQQQENIAAIREQTQIVQRFIQDILTVSRLDYQPTLDREDLDLGVLLSEIIRRLAPKAERKHIQLRLDMPESRPSISGDYEHLERAFTNLIDNALNYTPENGRVEIQVRAEGDRLVVDIADTGIGIKEQDLPHLFERFYRSEEARAFEKSGSGLGLAIVKKILDLHEGTIEVSSVADKGTTFRVQLPSLQPVAT